MMLTAKQLEASTISSTDFQRKVGTYLKEVKDLAQESLMITKQSKVEAVLVSPERYDALIASEERAEQLSIAMAIQRARQEDKRYTADDPEIQAIFSAIDSM